MFGFKPQKRLLDRQSGGVTDQSAGCTDDTVTRDDYADRIAVVGHADGPRCPGTADACGDLPIGTSPTVRNLAQSSPHLLLKRGALRSERQGKLAPAAVEILAQLRQRLPKHGRPRLRRIERNAETAETESGHGVVADRDRESSDRRTKPADVLHPTGVRACSRSSSAARCACRRAAWSGSDRDRPSCRSVCRPG